jgi:EAL domain-containing protein (putative c-di-GMP-specific phosphodiesterase class I)
MTTPKILVIDDDIAMGRLIGGTAKLLGLDCIVTSKAPDFLANLTPDVTLIVLDLVMPEVDGIELMRVLGKQDCKAKIILLSGSGLRVLETAKQLVRAHGLIMVGTLQKPFRVPELRDLLRANAMGSVITIPKKAVEISIPDEELRRAVRENEFVIHYQPQIDITTGRVVGVEALVRWQHPERGLLYPDRFIERMEDIGLIDQVGWIVAEQGLSDVGHFTGEEFGTLGLSLNISAYSLRDLNLPNSLFDLVVKYGVAINEVTLEVTETGLIRELSVTLDVLCRLRIKEAQLSIDDFGTGYSMMEQLRNIPATELKIDRSFVGNMLTHDQDSVIVRKTLEIGSELGMRVVAEGVETTEQLDYLRSHGCKIVQGYLFSRPLPCAEMVTWLNDYRSIPGVH